MASPRQVALFNEARAHFERGDLAGAETRCRTIVQRDRRDVNAWQLLGLVANRRGWFERSVPCFEQCVKLRPDEPMSHCQLASARMYQGRFDDAGAGFDQALRIRPGFPVAVRGKAELLERSGRLEEALALLAPIAEKPGADAETMLLHAALTEKTGCPEDAIAAAERGLAAPLVQPVTQRKLRFVIGKSLDRLRRYDEAIVAYGAANRLAARPFDPREAAQIDRFIAFFSRERLERLPRAAKGSELPVFIVGMPRSGSTLVEQIIDAHPDACGAGELTAFNEMLTEIPGKIGSSRPYPDWLEDVKPPTVDRLGKPYVARLAKDQRSATRIADKNLLNHRFLGAMALLYPGAHVIHCRRDPLDTAISCYVNDLSPVGFPWSTDLADIGRYYRGYRRLMEHWLDVLDLPILEVDYEALVDEQEARSREIIDFCGLAWDERCLEFHRTGRAVTTLSYDQVRRPIYRSAMKRWERYADHLGPLRAALAGDEGASP